MKPTDLRKHPEGGSFQEVYRSAASVTTPSGVERSALTHIYFSLEAGERSRFHKVASDEIWNLYRGTGVRLYTWDGSDIPPTCVTLSAQENCFCHVIRAGTWQAAEPVADTVLVGCSVAPGFEFDDFTLLTPNSPEAETLLAAAPDMKRFVTDGTFG